MNNDKVIQNRERFISRNNDKWSEYSLISEYKNALTKVLLRHNKCGHEFWMTPCNFSNGHGCPKCALVEKADALSKTKGSMFLDFMKTSKDYELVGEYTRNNKRVDIRHAKCGRTFGYLPVCFTQSVKNNRELCPFCNRERLSKKYMFSVAAANKRLAETNPEYKFITYSGASKEASIKHKICGHVFTGKASYFLLGDGHCPKCTTNISKEERQIYEWVKGLCPDARQSVRDLGWVSELDIYVPSKKVAIEFNGHWWHSLQAMTRPDKDGKPRKTPAEAKRFHFEKSEACADHGIRLIHIWDYEWWDERARGVIKNIVLGALGMLPERYYARECEVHRYDIGCERWSELNEFFKKNNIQGNRGGNVVFTLEKSGRILMAYKFGRPSSGVAKKKYEYEMVRGAAAPGVQVVGGATRLWKHAMDELNPKSVVYYVDFNYFDGRSVEKLGGKFVGRQPGVKNYWVDEKKVKNREPARHKEVKQAIEDGKVLELWNAGTKTYAFDFTGV